MHWGRRNRLLLVAWVVIVAVAVPVAALSRDTSVDAEAFVIASQLDIDMEALPRYAEAVFSNGEVASAVATTYGGEAAEVVPDRVSLAVEPDTVVLRVIGHDPDPETAAAIANVATEAFVRSLNSTGAGIGQFVLQAEAEPSGPAQPAGHEAAGQEADADAAELTSIAVSLAVGLAVGVAVGFALGRYSSSRHSDRGLGAAQDPLF
jgi:capsular polysaccharide biosynthesis protein